MLQRNNSAAFGLAMSRQSGAEMLHVSLWKLQVRFASDVEKKTLLNLLIMYSSNRRMVLHCRSRQLYQPKKYHKKIMAIILVARKQLNLGVRGPGEKPSWGSWRQDRMVPEVATLDRSPNQSLGVRPISPSHLELRGTRRGGPPRWSTDHGGPAVHTVEEIFLWNCPQGQSLTEG